MKIANKTALKLYECMLRIRHTEETIAERYSEWKMRCPTHLSIGQEAVAVGQRWSPGPLNSQTRCISRFLLGRVKLPWVEAVG